jgi:RimJ/RimL family protein N-acetyltransferase
MEGKIVFSGVTKSNNAVEIRYVKKDDAPAMLEYINTLSLERTFITLQGEQLSLKDEISYVNSQIKNMKNKRSILLLATVDKKVIGIGGVNMQEKTEKHIGVFHISVAQNFRGDGIGKALMKCVLEEAQNNIPDLKIITLTVFAVNTVAITLYKQFGFIQFGLLPNGSVRNEKYEDEVYMYKNVD